VVLAVYLNNRIFEKTNCIRLKMNVPERLRYLRKKKGLTQQEIAEQLHMSQNAYSLLESGKTKLDIQRLHLLAMFYQISVYDIIDNLPSPPIRNKFNYIILSYSTPNAL